MQLTSAQHTDVSLQLGRTIEHRAYFIRKCWIFRTTYWLLYWTWKTEWLCGYRIVVSISGVGPRDCMADWDLWSLPWSASQEDIVYCIALAWEQIKILSLVYGVYWMQITFAPSKVKKCKSNHCKLGSIFMVLLWGLNGTCSKGLTQQLWRVQTLHIPKNWLLTRSWEMTSMPLENPTGWVCLFTWGLRPRRTVYANVIYDGNLGAHHISLDFGGMGTE